MPGKVKVKIISGRNLPVMDRSSDTTDAYVEIKLGTTTYKTDVCRKSLHPKWNSEWYRFELDDAELQDEPLQIRLMDHDTYSANDAIGKVYLNLNPLLLPASGLLRYEWNGEVSRNRDMNAVMSGWIPVYDTMHGIRGEVNLTVKVELFSDSNKFRQSSCGVLFFYSKTVPHGYYAQTIHGFVEELIVSDDPEYQWIDKIRTPRASNEARQTLFFKLSGELQRKIGLKALEMGGNAVIAYTQCFDLEGESGIVARGIGTAVTLVKLMEPLLVPTEPNSLSEERTLKYLEFLGYKKSFRLNILPKNLSLFPQLEKFRECNFNEFDAAFKRAQFRRQISYTEFNNPSYSDSYLPTIQHSSSLQTLLRQEDMRGSAASGLSQRIRNLKYPSMFSKKNTRKIKQAKSEGGLAPARSITELVDQKKKKGIFRRTTSDSSVMAELLVRSVIHAQSSLDCISELNSDGGVQESQVCDVQSVVTSSSDSSGSDNEYDNLSDATENREDFDTVSDVVKNVELIERRLSSKNLRLFREIDEDRGEIYPNLVVPTEETEEISDQEQKTPPVAEEEDFSLVDSDEEKPEKFLIPPVLLGAEPNKSNLIETAIQTMLLEKVNILGSYSPPISPTQKETFGFQRVPTTLSLCESARDTVLGAPLVSPAMRKSEEQLANRSSSLERIKHSHKRRGSLTSLKSNRFTNFMSSLKGALKRDRSLLKAALKNVAMETVQDILATSHSNTNDPKSEPSRNQAVANTEIGTPSDNNVHASLTPDTRNSEAVRSLDQGQQRVDPVYLKFSRSPGILRRSSDSDLSVTPKGNSLTGSERSGHVPSSYCFRNNILLRSLPHKDNFDLLEYPFLSLSKCPPGFISYLGGTVCARSVKLLERITNPEEPETRDMWWSELRLEIRSHARTLNCNAVLGYCETTSICEDVCILSATGTAVIIRPNDDNFRKSQIIERNETEKDALDPPNPQESPEKDRSSSSPLPCTICHLPYNANAVPLRLTSSKCSSCRREKVPDILLATIELPDGVPLTGHGCLLQAHVCRMLRETRGESNAKEISDGLPFLEYELHRILVSKLKMRGMNAIFGLKVRITVGERMLVGLGTGTGVFLSALPPPSIPKLVSDHSDGKKVAEMQREIENVVRKNKEVYQITGVDLQNGSGDVDPRDVEVENSVFDYSSGNKDCCILEVDDPEDAEFLNLLMEHRPPDGFHAVTTQFLPGLEDADVVKNLQMFTQIWRSKVQPPIAVGKLFERLLQSVFFKLRRMVPCALCDLQFRLDLPEPDEIQLCVLGMALGLTELKKTVKKNDEELIFNYEEDQSPEASVIPMQRINKKRGSSYRDRHGVDITPLSFVPGAKIESYLGNLNFFLIRETQSIREEGGLSGFLHSFVTEALAIVRAHVTALGGNAMVAYFMTECVLNHNLHKNQGQCLINVGGDVVYVSYKEEKQ